ncbi:MAG TPA: phospholipase D family protein [Candidatus Binatia bacterium]|nr:phospholipase D family protein [Candidatus Binatia bacterium]
MTHQNATQRKSVPTGPSIQLCDVKLRSFVKRSYYYLAALLALSVLLVAGCAMMHKDYPRTASTAFQAHESTAIGKEIAAIAAQHPGESGFALIRRGRQAFTARVALADLAEKTLDVQYYLWEQDATGRILADHLIQAADRGVRVRVLVDDVNIEDRDEALASFDAHPNIEIRLFNPFPQRFSKLYGFLTDFNRVNHRMHNKLMVMDNALAIVGGRNMGDPYFEVDPNYNYRDLDIAAAGPVVRDLSNVFDRFWNGEWSVPIAALVDRAYTQEDLRLIVQRKREELANVRYPHPLGQDLATLKAELSTIIRGFIWAPGRVVFDDPSSIDDPNVRVMQQAMFKRLERVEKEVLVESPYFVPLARGVEVAKALVTRGVRVRVVTSSLASTDVLPAFAGYSISRKDLIRAGVEIHELRFEPGPARKRQLPAGSKAGLHTKTLVFDRKDVFIGSFNLDVRSATINTEAGLYVESPVLAAQVVDYLDDAAGPEVSYRVLLDEDGELYWVASEDGKPLRYDTDPLSTPGQRFQASLWSIFPILEQL